MKQYRDMSSLSQVNDNFLNVTGYNMSDWLVKTVDQYQKRRYGGFTLGLTNPFGQVNASQLQNLATLSGSGTNFSSTQQVFTDLQNVLTTGFTEDNVKVS